MLLSDRRAGSTAWPRVGGTVPQVSATLRESADQLRSSGLLKSPSPVLHFDPASLALTVKNGVIFDLGFLGNVEIVCGKGFHDFNLRFAIREP